LPPDAERNAAGELMEMSGGYPRSLVSVVILNDTDCGFELNVFEGLSQKAHKNEAEGIG
jgi:hypothetical protein